MYRFIPSCLILTSLFVLPQNRASASVLIGEPATGGDSVPFAGGLRYQQIYNAGEFPGVVAITGITFFDTIAPTGGIIDNTTYTISLSTSPQAVNSLSTDFAANRGPDEQVFFSGVLSGTLAGAEFDIAGAPFSYDPGDGNLLLEIVKASDPSHSPSISLDSSSGGAGSTGVYSRVFSFNSSGSAEFTPDSTGLVTEFQTIAVIPEPSTLTLACLGVAVLTAHRLRRRTNRRSG